MVMRIDGMSVLGSTQVLWPDGIFITKHPRNVTLTSSTALEDFGVEFPGESQYQGQQRPPMNSFEQRHEAARRAGVVRDLILGIGFSLSTAFSSSSSIRVCFIYNPPGQ